MKQFLLMIAVVGCVSTPGRKPLIADPIIEKVVRFYINKPTGELTKPDLEKLTFLNLGYNKLADVKGLQYLIAPAKTYTGPAGYTGTASLQKYEYFKLSNQLTNVRGLENLTQLTLLRLHNNQLADVKGLEKLTKLEVLDLGGNKLTNVKGLEKLTQLTELSLYNNQLTSVEGLEKLTQLEELFLHYNPDLTKAQIDQLQKALPNCKITHNANTSAEETAITIEAVIRIATEKPTGELTKADLEKLTRLSLHNTKLTNVKGLEKLTQLKELNLGGNQLRDVKGLEKLTQLVSLVLEGNPDLTKAQIDELKKALPKCKIYSNPTK